MECGLISLSPPLANVPSFQSKSCALNAKFLPVAFYFLHGHLAFLLPSPPFHQNEMNRGERSHAWQTFAPFLISSIHANLPCLEPERARAIIGTQH